MKTIRIAPLVIVTCLLAGCGGGGSNPPPARPDPEPVAGLEALTWDNGTWDEAAWQ